MSSNWSKPDFFASPHNQSSLTGLAKCTPVKAKVDDLKLIHEQTQYEHPPS